MLVYSNACWLYALELALAFRLQPLARCVAYITCKFSLLSSCFEAIPIPADQAFLLHWLCGDNFWLQSMQLAAVPSLFS